MEVDSDPDILALGSRTHNNNKMQKGKSVPEEETDVSAFVDVWRRRGFELKGEVELGNKMFVRMRFRKVVQGGKEREGRGGKRGKGWVGD